MFSIGKRKSTHQKKKRSGILTCKCDVCKQTFQFKFMVEGIIVNPRVLVHRSKNDDHEVICDIFRCPDEDKNEDSSDKGKSEDSSDVVHKNKDGGHQTLYNIANPSCSKTSIIVIPKQKRKFGKHKFVVKQPKENEFI